MVSHGAPLANDSDPDCPNCRGQGIIIALWNYIDASLVTQPGAPNLWTGDNTWADFMHDLEQTGGDSSDSQPPNEPGIVLTNHGQTNPEQLVEPDPRQAFQTAELTTNRGRHIPVYHQMGTPTDSRAESTWELQTHQEVLDLDEILFPRTEQSQGLGQQVSTAHVVYHRVVSLCYQAHT